MIAAAVALSGCTTVRFVSDYDEQVDRAATRLQHAMDLHLTTLESLGEAPEAAYPNHAAFYREYQVSLRSVRLRAQGHDRNETTIQQLDRMAASVEELTSQHRSSGVLSTAYVRTVRDLFNTGWAAIIAWEMAKKRGDA